MFDLNKIVSSIQNDPGTRNTAVSGLAGLAAGMLLSGGKPGKMVGNAVKLGAVAAVGGLAYKAWQNYQAGQDAPTHNVDESAFLTPETAGAQTEDLGKTLVRAMIAATKADGKIDAAEKEAIFDKLGTMQLSAEEKAWVFDELSSPLDINAVVAPVATPEVASEVYAASLVAMTADTPAERAYLEALSAKLGLDPALVREIELVATN